MIVELDLDFSQFRIHGKHQPGDPARISLDESLGLVRITSLGELWFVTLRQHGRIPVEVEVSYAQPPLDSGWGEVVEVSFFSTAECAILGYDESQSVHPLAVEARRDYRLRYSVGNLEAALSPFDPMQSPPLEQYRVQLWPADPSVPRVLVSTTTWGRSLQFAFAVELAAHHATELPEEARVDAFVRAALDARPPGYPSGDDIDGLVAKLRRQLWFLKVPTLSDDEFRAIVGGALGNGSMYS